MSGRAPLCTLLGMRGIFPHFVPLRNSMRAKSALSTEISAQVRRVQVWIASLIELCLGWVLLPEQGVVFWRMLKSVGARRSGAGGFRDG